MKKIPLIIFVAIILIGLIYFIYKPSSNKEPLLIGDLYTIGYISNNYYDSPFDSFKINNSFTSNNYDLLTVKNSILNNTKMIKKDIKEASLIVIWVGLANMYRDHNLFNYEYVDNFLTDLLVVINEVKRINPNIIVINYPEGIINKKYLDNINDYVDGIVKKEKLSLIDIRNDNYEVAKTKIKDELKSKYKLPPLDKKV